MSSLIRRWVYYDNCSTGPYLVMKRIYRLGHYFVEIEAKIKCSNSASQVGLPNSKHLMMQMRANFRDANDKPTYQHLVGWGVMLLDDQIGIETINKAVEKECNESLELATMMLDG